MKLKEYFAKKLEEFNEKRFFEKETIVRHTGQLQNLANRVLKLEKAVFKEDK